jgi:four helix bundle protein
MQQIAQKEENGTTKRYNLGERTLAFAKRIRAFLKKVPPTLGNIEDSKQLLRSSGSVAANYAEADEALSTKDFLMRLRICRKESKESGIHLQLIDTRNNSALVAEQQQLLQEAKELLLIFAAIIRKVE